MGDLELNLDLGPLDGAEEMLTQTRTLLEQAAQGLAIQTHAHVVEEAQHRLHSRREEFLGPKGLRLEQVSKNTWSITVPEAVRWIEDGQNAHNMLQDLLSSPKAKTSAKGNKYLVVPFGHSEGGPSSQTDQQRALVGTLKNELKARKIPWKGIEKGPDGQPRLGVVHRLFIGNKLAAAHHTVPLLHGVTIYQHQNLNRDGTPKFTKSGQPSVKRSIMTFRVASSTQAGTGKWEHPGNAPMHFLDEAHQWAENIWESQIKPQILSEIKG